MIYLPTSNLSISSLPINTSHHKTIIDCCTHAFAARLTNCWLIGFRSSLVHQPASTTSLLDYKQSIAVWITLWAAVLRTGIRLHMCIYVPLSLLKSIRTAYHTIRQRFVEIDTHATFYGLSLWLMTIDEMDSQRRNFLPTTNRGSKVQFRKTQNNDQSRAVRTVQITVRCCKVYLSVLFITHLSRLELYRLLIRPHWRMSLGLFDATTVWSLHYSCWKRWKLQSYVK